MQSSGEKRLAAVEQAEAIIESGVQHFVRWLDQRGAVPLIQALGAQTDVWRAAEVARARKAIARGDDVDSVLEALSRGVAQKLLHGTMVELNNADAVQRVALTDTVSRLFLRGWRDAGSAQRSADPADPEQ